MEIEKAIKRLKEDISKPLACGDIAVVEINDVEIVLKGLENKENKINKSLETISQLKSGMYRKGSVSYYFSGAGNIRLDIIREILEEK